MSRNKVVLLIAALVVIYLVLPAYGTGGLIRLYMITIAPYVLIFIIVYLIITINILKKSLNRLQSDISTDNVLAVSRMLRITFDVKRIMGAQNLIDLYKRVNFTKAVSFAAKESLYYALKRKRLDVPLPSDGTSEPAPDLMDRRTPEEIKAARLGSNKKNQHQKKKKRK